MKAKTIKGVEVDLYTDDTLTLGFPDTSESSPALLRACISEGCLRQIVEEGDASESGKAEKALQCGLDDWKKETHCDQTMAAFLALFEPEEM